jgi:hypothetical protein
MFACFAGSSSFISRIRGLLINILVLRGRVRDYSCRFKVRTSAQEGFLYALLNENCRGPLTSRGVLPILCSCCSPDGVQKLLVTVHTLAMLTSGPQATSVFHTAWTEYKKLSIVMLGVLRRNEGKWAGRGT